jgi:hypothetical protein
MTDKDARDPLTGKLLLHTIQSSNNGFHITSIIAKDNKSTYNKFLQNIFEFGQELRDDGIPELGWKPFRVSKPQDMKRSQLCMNPGGSAKQIPYFFTCAKDTVMIVPVPIKPYVASVREFVKRDLVIIIQ